ncbi:MAG TPA: NAD(P)/FAD-dependent oxidoreductase [Pseudolabrys sp.]|nr:NAD(P)/FAD-dependent oxidoreductase [Pseudolabrys sp.]
MKNCRECDVVVVGGGPAGSTIAALLAQKRKSVVLLEKEHFPRFHIGESLLPLNLPLFDLLGVADEIRRIGVYKPGAELISDEHGATVTFRFSDNPYLSVGYSYQVRRSDFDKLLLDNSRRLGADVIEGARVTDITFDAEHRSRVTATGADGMPLAYSARFLVDASGRDTLLASRLRLKRADKHNNTAAVFGHFRNVPARPGDVAGMISVYLFEHGWIWMIPLPDDVTSVGVVGTQTFFKARDARLDALFARAVAASPSVADRMANARPIGSLVACADYSYDSRYYVGEGHILVGDAAAFIDPLFSSGVMMAMSTAAFGATVVEASLDGLDSRERHMRDYERKIRLSLRSLSWLIYRINSPILRDLLMSSFDLFNTRQRLITILAGDFYESRSFLSPLRRLQLAYGCLFLLSKIGFRLRAGGIEWRSSQHGTGA